MTNPFETIEKRQSNIENLLLDISHTINELKQNFAPKTPTQYLTRSEVAELLKCDISTVYNWTKRGKLKPYGIGNRVYFKRAEIEEMLIPLSENER